MELGDQIKNRRQNAHLSQEELAQRMYVSRQTISNWENGKSYPDVHNLILLSEIFRISLDELIKGDIEMMKSAVRKDESEKLKRYYKALLITVIVTVVTIIPLYTLLGYWAFVPLALVCVFFLYYSYKLEKLHKDNDLITFKEVLAFMDGQNYNDPHKPKTLAEKRARVLRNVILGFIIGIVTGMGVGSLMSLLLKLIKLA